MKINKWEIINNKSYKFTIPNSMKGFGKIQKIKYNQEQNRFISYLICILKKKRGLLQKNINK